MKQIRLNSGEIVEMNAPTVGVLKNAMKQSTEMEQAIHMIAAITNKTTSEIEALEISDYMKLQKELTDFLGEAGVTA